MRGVGDSFEVLRKMKGRGRQLSRVRGDSC